MSAVRSNTRTAGSPVRGPAARASDPDGATAGSPDEAPRTARRRARRNSLQLGHIVGGRQHVRPPRRRPVLPVHHDHGRPPREETRPSGARPPDRAGSLGGPAPWSESARAAGQAEAISSALANGTSRSSRSWKSRAAVPSDRARVANGARPTGLEPRLQVPAHRRAHRRRKPEVARECRREQHHVGGRGDEHHPLGPEPVAQGHRRGGAPQRMSDQSVHRADHIATAWIARANCGSEASRPLERSVGRRASNAPPGIRPDESPGPCAPNRPARLPQPCASRTDRPSPHAHAASSSPSAAHGDRACRWPETPRPPGAARAAEGVQKMVSAQRAATFGATVPTVRNAVRSSQSGRGRSHAETPCMPEYGEATVARKLRHRALGMSHGHPMARPIASHLVAFATRPFVQSGDMEEPSDDDRGCRREPGTDWQAAWETEDNYWFENFSSRPYALGPDYYDRFRPAFRYGFESAQHHLGRTWDDAEPDLRQGWDALPAPGATLRPGTRSSMPSGMPGTGSPAAHDADERSRSPNDPRVRSIILMADSIRDLFFGRLPGRELVEAIEPRRSFDDVVLPAPRCARSTTRWPWSASTI